jgi:hypothetical protein
MESAAHEPLAFDELGWRQFFDLCAGVLEVDAGVRAGLWVGVEDRDWHVIAPAGLDLAGCPALPGPCYVRSVWVPDRARVRRSVALEGELVAVRDELTAEGWADSVLVLSNYAGVFADRSRVPDFFGSDRAVLLGPGWLSGRVDGSALLRRSMPSLLGLGDLDRWLAPGARARSTLDVGAARELSSVFVPTRAYARAIGVLQAHHFAVLTGPPEMGKTAIARMTGLALMTDGWEAFECTAPDEIDRVFDAGRRQVFIADDAFGSTEFRPEAAERWAREMESLLRMMDQDHWLIWTSRPAPLRAGLGRIHRERGAERFPRPGEVLVDAGALSLDEKVLILLRHAKATCTPAVRSGLRAAGYTIVSHPHFTPERIRRLAAADNLPLHDIGSHDLDTIIAEQIRTPTGAMAASFRALSSEHQALLYAFLDAPPGPVEERELAHLTRRHRPEGLSSSPMELVDRLTDHFLRVSDTLKVDWVHPSWRDLVIERLREDAPAREAFLHRCTLEGVMLAISTAGGATGARSSTLLVTDHDWDLVTDQVMRAVREASDADVTRLLDALVVAVREASTRGTAQSSEAYALAGAALRTTCRRCDRDSGPLDVDVLTAWFTLACRVPERLAPPCLDRTWTELLPSNTTDLRVQVDLDQAIGWLRLADLLQTHAPEQLAVYGFPEQHRDRMNALLSQVVALLSKDPRHAGRQQLVRLLRLGLRSRMEVPATLRPLFEQVSMAGESLIDDPLPEASPFTEWTIRAHVERVLEDL